MDINGLLNEEQFLLKQKDELFLDRVVIQDNLKLVGSKLENIQLEKDFLKKYKKEVISKYINNIFQIALTGVVVDIPFHILSTSSNNVILSDYIIGGSILYTVGLLTLDLIIQIKDYKNNNTFEKKEEIQKKYESLERALEQNQLCIDDTIEELDNIYNLLLPDSVKTKKKEVR